jgi:hypothetical protein
LSYILHIYICKKGRPISEKKRIQEIQGKWDKEEKVETIFHLKTDTFQKCMHKFVSGSGIIVRLNTNIYIVGAKLQTRRFELGANAW